MPLTGDRETIWETVRMNTDYGRACGVDDYLGVLKVGPGECLVLADEPMQTTIFPTNADALIVRWMYAESGAEKVSGTVNDRCRPVADSFWVNGGTPPAIFHFLLFCPF
jgi:hypothetical protein